MKSIEAGKDFDLMMNKIEGIQGHIEAELNVKVPWSKRLVFNSLIRAGAFFDVDIKFFQTKGVFSKRYRFTVTGTGHNVYRWLRAWRRSAGSPRVEA